jgi:hypothetical protein
MKTISGNRRYSFALTVLFCSIFTIFSIHAFAREASVVRITQVNGTVVKNGAPAREGDVVERGDQISSGEKSSVILTWSNGSIMEIYPASSIILQGIMYEGDKKVEKTFVVLENGRVFTKAQVPEHMFEHFELNAGGIPLITQGAEFALKYDQTEKKITLMSVIGRMLIDLGMGLKRVEEEHMAEFQVGTSTITPVPLAGKTRDALIKTSKRLGGSLLIEEESTFIGGPLRLKIGGVRNRRGNSPFIVKFKLLMSGGSGKVKSIIWNFGDGSEAEGKKAEHTFTQGVYGVIVRVEDENGEKASAQINIAAETECGC